VTNYTSLPQIPQPTTTPSAILPSRVNQTRLINSNAKIHSARTSEYPNLNKIYYSAALNSLL